MKIDVDGLSIEYRDEGAGLPVILIHAFPLNQSMWDEQVVAQTTLPNDHPGPERLRQFRGCAWPLLHGSTSI